MKPLLIAIGAGILFAASLAAIPCNCKEHTVKNMAWKQPVEPTINSMRIEPSSDTIYEGRNYLLYKVKNVVYQNESWANVAYVYDDVGQILTKVINPKKVTINGKEILPR